MLLLPLLAALFAPAVDATASPSFRVRERGSAVLGQFWPLSAPAIEAGLLSPDPEVRRRCQAAPPRTWRADWAAASLVGHEHTDPRTGLPLADPVQSPRWSCWTDWTGTVRTVTPRLPPGVSADQLRRAVLRLAEVHGVPTVERYYFGESEFWSTPFGWDFVRLRLRGIPVSSPGDLSTPEGISRLRAALR